MSLGSKREYTLKAGLALDTSGHSVTKNGLRAMLPIDIPTNDPELSAIIIKALGPVTSGLDYGEGQGILFLSDADGTVAAPTIALKTITATTNATPVKVTAVAHGWSTGDNVRISGTGISALDGGAGGSWNKTWKITKVDNDNFTLDTSVAPGSTSAIGKAFSDRHALLMRLIDSSLGVGNIHLANGLRNRSGSASNGGLALDVDPSQDCLGVLIRNAQTDEWSAATTLAFFAIQDTRGASGARTLLQVEKDGLVTLRPQEGKASTATLLRTRNDGDSADLFLLKNDGGFHAPGIVGIGNSGPLAGIQALIIPAAVGTIGLELAQFSSGQTAALMQWADASGGVVYGTIDKLGYVGIRKNTIPADADVITGECKLWFDKTTGAAKFGLKGKNNAGTVVTALVAMA
jgi:hypothetical protein